MQFEQIILTFGYSAVLMGTFLQGEAILLAAGIAAHQGYIQLHWTIVMGFLGAFSSDQFYFFMGRSKGMVLLNKKPRWRAKSHHIFKYIDRHQLFLILGFRFLIGLRTVIAFFLGSAGTARSRFMILDIIGSMAWSFAVVLSGYFLGHAVPIVIKNVQIYEILFVALVLIIWALIWSVHWFKRVRIKQPTSK